MSEPEITPPSESSISTNPNERGNANLIYILYLAGLVVGITSIVGVVMAYMGKDEAPDWLKTHYRHQINIFWKMVLFSVVGIVLSLILIGVLVLLFALIWYIVRTVKGMQALSKGEPYPDPSGWGF
ncbi:MAG: hypothetical protein DHS20C05_12900 [Hyphococcus sp.]|nr:MAG: hypothetical protein DHS20C05_12900 [Marinicaulis sp.]